MSWSLLTLSGADPDAVLADAQRLGDLAQAAGERLTLDELAGSLAQRPALPWRLAVVAASVPDAAEVLLSLDERRLLRGCAAQGAPGLTYLFPGVGSHHPAMAAGLYRSMPVFRSVFDRCVAVAAGELGTDPSKALVLDNDPYDDLPVGSGRPVPDLASILRGAAGDDPLDEPTACQVLVFAVECGLAAVLTKVGLAPSALLGYSVGEYAAAVAGEVLTLDEAARIVAQRASLCASTPAGGMLAVLAGPADVEARLATFGKGLVVAAVEGPTLTVVSGPAESVEGFERTLLADGVACRGLPVRHGFHSPLMAPVEAPLRVLASRCDLAPPSVPILSNSTGTWLTDADAADPAYWAAQPRLPVLFSRDLAALWQCGPTRLVEVGPGGTLGTLALQHPDRPESATAATTVPGAHARHSGLATLLTALGTLWLRGAPVDLVAVAALQANP